MKNRQSGLTTIELSTKKKYEHQYLLRYHVWGCPVYVLDPKLQNHQKIPRRNHRSRLGEFLGFSNEHSSLVANVRKLQTGYTLPQYNVVVDDIFQTVFSSGKSDVILDSICNHLFEDNCDWYSEEEHEYDKCIYHPCCIMCGWLKTRVYRIRIK